MLQVLKVEDSNSNYFFPREIDQEILSAQGHPTQGHNLFLDRTGKCLHLESVEAQKAVLL